MTTKQTIFFALYKNLLENQEGNHGKQIMPQLATSCTYESHIIILLARVLNVCPYPMFTLKTCAGHLHTYEWLTHVHNIHVCELDLVRYEQQLFITTHKSSHDGA